MNQRVGSHPDSPGPASLKYLKALFFRLPNRQQSPHSLQDLPLNENLLEAVRLFLGYLFSRIDREIMVLILTPPKKLVFF